MRRRQVLTGSAALAGSSLLRPARAATPANTIRFVPQADLSSIDPVWTTATVAFNHGLMVYDTLYGIDASLTPQPQMVESHQISDDKADLDLHLAGRPVVPRRRAGALD